jgi:hypothetical protein
MPPFSFKKADVPFLLDGKGGLSVEIGTLDPTKSIPPDAGSMLDVTFSADGAQQTALGQTGTVKIGVSTSAHARLVPLFSDSDGAAADLLKANGLDGFFAAGANPGKLILAFDVGASADATAAGSFVYAPLTATVTLDAGADGGYTYLRAIPKTTPLFKAIPDFVKSMKLPEQVTQAPDAGEALSIRYGGYLRLGAEVAAGYELAGTKACSISQLALSERYGLSILGKIGLSAGIAGRFSILVMAGDRPGWARVQVKRNRSADLRVAADVTVTFANELDGLPGDANEFLGAVLGVNGKSFLTVLERARDLGKFDTISAAVDGLAKKYIETLIGKGFDALADKTELAAFLERVNKVVASYQTLEDRAVTLFDRYFDRLPMLTEFLDRLAALDAKGLEQLRGTLNPELFNILSQLTDGDPLGFLAGKVILEGEQVDAVRELRARANAGLDLIRKRAHQELRDAIAAAKKSFRIDDLFREAAKIDSVDELKALAAERVGLFVSRLVGRTLDSSTNLKAAFEELKQVIGKLDTFTASFFKAVREATNSSYRVALHAEYSQATERDALVDVLINLANPQGAAMLAQTARGDFHAALTTPNTGLVRILDGVLTHRTRRESAFKVNIVGWHLNYSYEGFDRVITESEQRFVTSDRGILILSTTKLEVDRGRKRQDETMHVNFLLRALGESSGAIAAGRNGTLQYLIESLTALTASYQLAFTDDDTSRTELEDYLTFARDLQLDQEGATLEALTPFLQRAANGGFGRVETSYDVRFGSAAIDALLTVKRLTPDAETRIRSAMRAMVLSNYLKSASMHDVAFAYATPGVFALFQQLGFAAFTNVSRAFRVAPVLPVAAPQTVSLDKTELNVLATLYGIENDMVEAIAALIKMLNARATLAPEAFEKKLGKFGDALLDFDRFDQASSGSSVGTTTIFAMFDLLIRLATGGPSANIGVLRLKSRANDKDIEKLFMTGAAAAAP